LPDRTDQPSITVRLATIDEAPAIANVLHQTFAEFEPLYTPGGFTATSLDTEHVLTRWNDGPVWVAVLDSAIVGTVAAMPREGGLYVRSMAVLPSARGLGVGKLLMEELERYAITGRYPRMFLNTTHFFLAAIHLYENCGFERTGDSNDLHGTPLLVMEKRLAVQG